jgi:hypothetical protein
MEMDIAEKALHDFMNKRPEYVMNMMNRFFKLGTSGESASKSRGYFFPGGWY